MPVALTRYNTDERLTRVTAEFCRRTIREVEKLQKEFRRTLGVTFAFLGDEIYIKAGAEIPSRRHYGNYPQIEDGVGMVRSFLNAFEKVLNRRAAKTQSLKNVRTHAAAIKPKSSLRTNPQSAIRTPQSKRGTLLTGEMFAPILRAQMDKYNSITGSSLHVLAVPNTYFGGDVAVAGLLTGQDLVAVRASIKGDFAFIPKSTIKSDEPIFLDGMTYDDLKMKFPVPVYDVDAAGLIEFLTR